MYGILPAESPSPTPKPSTLYADLSFQAGMKPLIEGLVLPLIEGLALWVVCGRHRDVLATGTDPELLQECLDCSGGPQEAEDYCDSKPQTPNHKPQTPNPQTLNPPHPKP